MMETIVIRTTFPKQSDPDSEAVAIAGPGQLGRFVRPRPDEQERILTQLRPLIAKMERDEIAKWLSNSYPDVRLTEVFRVSTPNGVKHVTTRPTGWNDFDLTKAPLNVGGSTYYYLDGEKLFTTRVGDECMLNLATEGVVEVGRDGRVFKQHLSSAAYSGFCGDRAESTEPMAAVSIGSRTVWIVKSRLEDGYDYLLVDPDTGDGIELKGRWALRKSADLRHESHL